MIPTSRMIPLAGVALILVAAALGFSDARAGGKDESYTKVTASAGKIDKDGSQLVTVVMDITSPWYAYANPVGDEDLESARTKVLITSAVKLKEVTVTYPPGK